MEMKDILVSEFKVVAKGLLNGVVALFAIAMIFYFVLGLAFGMVSVPPLSAMVGTLVWVVCIVLASARSPMCIASSPPCASARPLHRRAARRRRGRGFSPSCSLSPSSGPASSSSTSTSP